MMAIWSYAVLTAVFLFVVYRRRQGNKLRKAVFFALDHSLRNGYLDDVVTGSPDELAYDLTVYWSHLASARPEELTPYVRQWLRRKGKLS